MRGAHRHQSLLPMVPLLVLLATSAVARDNHTGVGAAIAPAFSIQHDAMRPGEDVTLLLGVVNQNAHATHGLQRGDTFRFDFRDGVVGECGTLSVFSPDGALSVLDFTCLATARAVTLMYVGAGSTWPMGDAACVEVPYSVGDASSTVLCSHEVGTNGAYAPPSPPVLLLSIARDIGGVGPPGPVGPMGPAGPPGPAGPSATGAAQFLTTTGAVRAVECADPVTIPGLDTSVVVAGGSRVLLLLDARAHPFCDPIDTVPGNGRVAIELDGESVADRVLDSSFSGGGTGSTHENLTLVAVSGPLVAGSHTVRCTVGAEAPCGVPPPDERTPCVGSPSVDGRQARLTVIELRN